jgi:hypothetical protein
MVDAWDLKGREFGVNGEIRGRLAFEWMEGGSYLIQRVDIDYAGRKLAGTEYVGYDKSKRP